MDPMMNTTPNSTPSSVPPQGTPSGMSPMSAGESKDMSTGVKVVLWIIIIAIVGGVLYYFVSSMSAPDVTPISSDQNVTPVVNRAEQDETAQMQAELDSMNFDGMDESAAAIQTEVTAQ